MEREPEAGGRSEGERTPRSIVMLFVIVVVGALAHFGSQVRARRLEERTPIPSPREEADERRFQDVSRRALIVSELEWQAAMQMEIAEVPLRCAPAEYRGVIRLEPSSPCGDLANPAWTRLDRDDGAPREWLPLDQRALRRAEQAAGRWAGEPRIGVPRPLRGPRGTWRRDAELADRRLDGPLPTSSRWDGDRACDEAAWRAAEHGVMLLACDPDPARRKDFYDEISIGITVMGESCAIAEWLQDCGAPPGLLKVAGLTVVPGPGSGGVIAEAAVVTFAWRDD